MTYPQEPLSDVPNTEELLSSPADVPITEEPLPSPSNVPNTEEPLPGPSNQQELLPVELPNPQPQSLFGSPNSTSETLSLAGSDSLFIPPEEYLQKNRKNAFNLFLEANNMNIKFEQFQSMV